MKRVTKTIAISAACLLITGAAVGGVIGIVKYNKSKNDVPLTPEHIHVEVMDNAFPPSCIGTGLTEGKHCATCNEVLTEQTVIAALGHTEVIDTGQASTCTTTGTTDGKHCSVCGAITVEPQPVPITAHKYINGVCTMCDMDDPSATLDVNAFYLIGSMNNWAWTSDRYRFIPVATDIANVTSQYKLTVSLDENTQFKVWRGNGDFYDSFETSDYLSYMDDGNGHWNPINTQAGKYNFYLKFYNDGGHSVYVEKIN